MINYLSYSFLLKVISRINFSVSPRCSASSSARGPGVARCAGQGSVVAVAARSAAAGTLPRVLVAMARADPSPATGLAGSTKAGPSDGGAQRFVLSPPGAPSPRISPLTGDNRL